MPETGRSLEQQIQRAKELLDSALHAALATVNTDGSPHNTPLVFVRNLDLSRIFWSSHPDSQHSQNVVRSGQVFVVLYEANERGGLYIRADEARVAEGVDLDEALEAHNQLRSRHGKEPLSHEYYSGSSPQRMWLAETKQFWVNASQRDEQGQVIKDIRTQIDRAVLTKS